MLFLTTAYLAPVEYYILLNSSSEIIIEKQDNYIKQTYRNRCIIAGANGLQTLSIPIVKPDNPKCLTKDIQIADHGNWRHLHWNAIVSAYNSTPFFEYYADDFYPFYEKKIKYLFDFNEQLRELICLLLDVSPNIAYSTEYTTDLTPGALDLRERIHPKKEAYLTYFKPYYQVFDNKYGFYPNLSIVDLLFNMGPESILWLLKKDASALKI
ncbi:WbqC family protein [Bacteroidales bacterium OttesenSCG-928-M06]|nr:WbqC family protein [Bacteroidales bacterium OttesenSCG-928-M06]